jgi:putative FmdB family regulatory protein
MPTYEFRCPEGHEFEKFYRSISGSESEAACPVCGLRAERMMSAAGFAFKGSGFYLTDYGKNAHRDKGTPDPKSAAKEGGSEPVKADGGTGESKGDGGKTEGAKSSDSPTPVGDSKKAERKSETSAADKKPAPGPPPPKSGASE